MSLADVYEVTVFSPPMSARNVLETVRGTYAAFDKRFKEFDTDIGVQYARTSFFHSRGTNLMHPDLVAGGFYVKDAFDERTFLQFAEEELAKKDFPFFWRQRKDAITGAYLNGGEFPGITAFVGSVAADIEDTKDATYQLYNESEEPLPEELLRDIFYGNTLVRQNVPGLLGGDAEKKTRIVLRSSEEATQTFHPQEFYRLFVPLVRFVSSDQPF